MNVAELIDELRMMDPEAEVHFEYNYGDHWRTHVAPKVTRRRRTWLPTISCEGLS